MIARQRATPSSFNRCTYKNCKIFKVVFESNMTPLIQNQVHNALMYKQINKKKIAISYTYMHTHLNIISAYKCCSIQEEIEKTYIIFYKLSAKSNT